jgi:hypothetical protein
LAGRIDSSYKSIKTCCPEWLEVACFEEKTDAKRLSWDVYAFLENLDASELPSGFDMGLTWSSPVVKIVEHKEPQLLRFHSKGSLPGSP